MNDTEVGLQLLPEDCFNTMKLLVAMICDMEFSLFVRNNYIYTYIYTYIYIYTEYTYIYTYIYIYTEKY